MRLFQNHGLDREFSEIFRVGSTLIIRVTGLSCELEITKTGFLCQFFLLYLMDHELRCIVFPILKKIVFSQVILITFLFKFDSSIVVSIFFLSNWIKASLFNPVRFYDPSSKFLFFLKDMFMTAGYYFLRKTMVQPRDEAHAPKLV